MKKVETWYWKYIYSCPKKEASFDWFIAFVVGGIVCTVACWLK